MKKMVKKAKKANIKVPKGGKMPSFGFGKV